LKTAGVAVINEAMARKFWTVANPIGERITIDKYLGPDFAAAPREIVGIVGDVRDLALNQDPVPIIYIPQAQVPNGMTGIDTRILPMTWSVRTIVEPYSLRTPIGRALTEASGGLAVAHVRSMDEVIRHSMARSDFNGILLTAFAAASLLLAAVGIYGLIVFSVQQREQEIAIRLAIGASPQRVRNMVLSQGTRLAAGVIAGALGSLALTHSMTSLIYGVKPVDPVVIAVSSLTLGAVAALASYIPANRASRLDPAKALRST